MSMFDAAFDRENTGSMFDSAFQQKDEATGIPKEELQKQLKGIDPNPWVDPITVAASAFGGGIPSLVKGGLSALARIAASAGVSSVLDIPVGQATDYVAKNHPNLAIPFNIALGAYINLKGMGKAEQYLQSFAKKELGAATDGASKEVAKKIETNLTKGDLSDPNTKKFVNFIGKQHQEIMARPSNYAVEGDIPASVGDLKTPANVSVAPVVPPQEADLARQMRVQDIADSMLPQQPYEPIRASQGAPYASPEAPTINQYESNIPLPTGPKAPEPGTTTFGKMEPNIQPRAVPPTLDELRAQKIAKLRQAKVPQQKAAASTIGDETQLGNTTMGNLLDNIMAGQDVTPELDTMLADLVKTEGTQGLNTWKDWLNSGKIGARIYTKLRSSGMAHATAKANTQAVLGPYEQQFQNVQSKFTNPLMNQSGAVNIGDIAQGVGETKSKIDQFFDPFLNLPNNAEYTLLRGKAKGTAARYRNFAGNIRKKLMQFDDASRERIFNYLDGQIGAEDLQPDEVVLSKRIKKLFNSVGSTLHEEGLIHEPIKDYIPYLYERYLMEGKSPQYWRARKEMTPDIQAKLGFVNDAGVAAPMSFHQTLQDLAKVRMYKQVAANPEWTWQPANVDVQGIKYSAGDLMNEIGIYRKMIANSPGNEAYKLRLGELEAGAQQIGNPPDKGWKIMPTGRQWGALSGQYVRKEIYDDLVPYLKRMDQDSAWTKLLQGANQTVSAFKLGKVALNLPTAARNVVSNVIQLNMSGMAVHRVITGYVDAAKSMLNKDKYYKMAQKMGLFETNFSKAELEDVMRQFKKARSFGGLMARASKLGKYYGRIDDISKLNKFKYELDHGASAENAYMEAQKWGMDYSIAPSVVKGARSTIAPFITYPYKMVGLLKEAAKERPWTVLKYQAIPMAMTQYTLNKYNMTEDDYKQLRKQLPSYIRNSNYTIVPSKSPEGNWQWVNLNYYLPWQNIISLGKDATEGASPGQWMQDIGIGNPILNTFYSGASTVAGDVPKDLFTGGSIYDPVLDTPKDKIAKITNFLWNQFAPSMVGDAPIMAYNAATGQHTTQGFSALDYTSRWLKGQEDKYGRKVTPGQALGRWAGVNLIAPSSLQRRKEMSAKIYDLIGRTKSRLQDPSLSDAEKQKLKQRVIQQIQMITQGKEQ